MTQRNDQQLLQNATVVAGCVSLRQKSVAQNAIHTLPRTPKARQKSVVAGRVFHTLPLKRVRRQKSVAQNAIHTLTRTPNAR